MKFILIKDGCGLGGIQRVHQPWTPWKDSFGGVQYKEVGCSHRPPGNSRAAGWLKSHVFLVDDLRELCRLITRGYPTLGGNMEVTWPGAGQRQKTRAIWTWNPDHSSRTWLMCHKLSALIFPLSFYFHMMMCLWFAARFLDYCQTNVVNLIS